MFEFISTWQFSVVAFLVSNVFFFQFNRLAVKDAKDEGAATMVLQGFAVASILLLVPFFAFDFADSLKVYGLLGVASLFYALNDRLQTPIRKNLDVSTFTIIYQLVFVFLIAYGLVVRGEALQWQRTVGGLVIIAANLFVVYEGKKLQVNKFIGMAVVAALSLALAISIDVDISTNFNLPIYIFLTLFIPGVLIAASEKISPQRVVNEYNRSDKRSYIVAGVAWALTIFFSLRAFSLGEVTTVVPIQSFSVILNVIVAYMFFGEKQSPRKKFFASIIATFGILLTVF